MYYIFLSCTQLLSSIDPKVLRLTKLDDQIYEEFKRCFSKLAIDILVEDDLKSKESKEVWRGFCENYKETVQDYNLGTLIRLDSSKEYNAENSCVVPRVQFLAIELARNREGVNDSIRQNFKPKKRQP